ncbi:MAG: hypothetical protein LBH36_01280 [Candidatus Nomurabacteria bacterium]|jgi:hypothetical protein|nr:hypothetical protein [Candidatus Nomurabacteria bacterium]
MEKTAEIVIPSSEREDSMEELRKKYIFLLGGHDGEMAEIKRVLDENGFDYVDKNLAWGANIEDYFTLYKDGHISGREEYQAALHEHIDKYNKRTGLPNDPISITSNILYPDNLQTVAIELDGADKLARDDSTGIKFIDINHHGERSDEPASLIQVLSLLGIKPTREQELIAASDSGYIPAMQELGATQEEIDRIRLFDRQAQGITHEQDQEAERAIEQKEVNGRLTVIKMSHSKSVTITDRLFGQYDQLLVLSQDGASNYFGDGKICKDLHDEFGGWAGGTGLGKKDESAYWGSRAPQGSVLAKIEQKLSRSETIDLEKTIFIVPNNDAEALAIQQLLQEHGADFIITNQPWGASWDGLENTIRQQILENSGKQIFGVELKGNSSFEDGYNIDHHSYSQDDRTTEKTSLRQIAELIGVELNAEQLFIEANDIGYIPEMQKIGERLELMPDEIAYYINQVNELEAKAQGITPEIKEMAKKAVDEAYIYDERFIWIELPSMTAMREVTNILYEKGKYRDLLYNTATISTSEDEGRVIVFSRAEVIAKLKKLYPDEITWNGGGTESGFWGVQVNHNPEKKAQIAGEVRSLLEQELLGYHRLIEQSDIEASRTYSDDVQTHTINNPDAFYTCIKAAHDDNPHGAFLNMDYAPEDYTKMTMFVVNAGAAGIAVKPDGDVVSVFKNPDIARKDSISRINQALMIEALRAGGKKLDCFDGFLPSMYSGVGFVPVCKLKFNDEYSPDGWNFERDGRPDIVFMAHVGDNVETVINRQSNAPYPDITQALADAPYIENYDQASELVQKYLATRSNN